MNDRNPHLDKLDQLQAAQTAYQELRWRLNFLTLTRAEPDQEPLEEQILDWNTKLCKRDLN